MSACMYLYGTSVSVLNTEQKRFLEIVLSFYFIVCRRSDTSVLKICHADNEITGWKWVNFTIHLSPIYFASVIGKLHQHTTIPFVLREMGNLKYVSVFFLWNVDTSEGDKSFSNKEKRMKAGRNYVFFHALSTVFLEQSDYKGIMCWWIYTLMCWNIQAGHLLTKHTVPGHGKRPMFSFWICLQSY